jgi:hypothetical protein
LKRAERRPRIRYRTRVSGWIAHHSTPQKLPADGSTLT